MVHYWQTGMYSCHTNSALICHNANEVAHKYSLASLARQSNHVFRKSNHVFRQRFVFPWLFILQTELVTKDLLTHSEHAHYVHNLDMHQLGISTSGSHGEQITPLWTHSTNELCTLTSKSRGKFKFIHMAHVHTKQTDRKTDSHKKTIVQLQLCTWYARIHTESYMVQWVSGLVYLTV